MQGQILDYSIQSNSGVITTKEGQRYQFEGSEWKDASLPSRGMEVDFDVDANNQAIGVYKALRSSNTVKLGSTGSKGKSRIVAGVLALFLGGYGIHKFYLGITVPGIINWNAYKRKRMCRKTPPKSSAKSCYNIKWHNPKRIFNEILYVTRRLFYRRQRGLGVGRGGV